MEEEWREVRNSFALEIAALFEYPPSRAIQGIVSGWMQNIGLTNLLIHLGTGDESTTEKAENEVSS